MYVSRQSALLSYYIYWFLFVPPYDATVLQPCVFPYVIKSPSLNTTSGEREWDSKNSHIKLDFLAVIKSDSPAEIDHKLSEKPKKPFLTKLDGLPLIDSENFVV